uniref:Endonuclease/exonuclease/phosphatase domain-containing protein n=1 Tax=Pipistrellus kuhlii TaxID=59472 RepID=A0A7J8A826_PIPKU|nr:hypothetical protein mPipKuh1_008940 [Pipistrellus kuhlii]
MYTPNSGAPKYIQKLLEDVKGEIDSNTIIVGDFNTPLSPMVKSSKQKISKETSFLNDSLDQIKLINIFRTFHPKGQNIHSSQVHMGHFQNRLYIGSQAKLLQVQEDRNHIKHLLRSQWYKTGNPLQ